ncbi:MAG: hypothetical protein DRN61_06900 [Thaumarchaeota archaeon]|nr:MAG: hypothetical protein DRN61_06900 [Nitrososphaerota archaeon]
MKIRRPAVAGSFYKGDRDSLVKQIEWCFLHKLGPGSLPRVDERGPRHIIAMVCPHAGYMYSGPTAAHSYHKLASDGLPELVVLIGPNHSGIGAMVSVSDAELWRTPLGDVTIDRESSSNLVRKCGIAELDSEAHFYEHSLEVQLPFLQYLYGTRFKVVAITMMLQDISTCRDLGYSLAELLAEKNAVIIASTDFTHYEPYEVAREKDALAIKAILNLDAQELLNVVKRNNISMCGPGPVATAIIAAKALNASNASLLSYTTSGDIAGFKEEVVGYGSIVISK